jgi:uncharacterized protein (DUF2236 family)
MTIPGGTTGTLPLPKSSVSYRVALEPALVVGGGPAALLLQVAQPSVGAGVGDHSDYETRPWERLFRTLELMTVLSFATPERSAEAVELLRRRHAAVRGTRADGVAYRALDPDLLLWVWATLFNALAETHERFVRPLRDDERDQLYEEFKLVGYACGIPVARCPDTYAAFVDYFERTIRELEPTPVAQNVATQMRTPPLPFPLNLVAGSILSVLTGGQLPPALRAQLGFSWSPAHQILFDAAALASRTGARVVPGRLRRLPMALALRFAA